MASGDSERGVDGCGMSQQLLQPLARLEHGRTLNCVARVRMLPAQLRMHHVLIVASRVATGLFSCICFYLAFFLYEDEEGHWQNRIDDLWITIDDRARITKSTSTALLNKLGEAMKRLFGKMFGQRMFSYHAVVISFNLSLACGFSAVAIGILFFTTRRDLGSTSFWYELAMLIGFCAFFFFLAILPMLTDMIGVLVFCSFPLIATILLIAFGEVSGTRNNPFLGMTIATATVCSVLALSALSDFVVVITIRRLFATMSVSLSMRKLAGLMSVFVGLPLIFTGVPMLLTFTHPIGYVKELATFLVFLNISTTFMCLVPLLSLIVILLHRVVWPTLARALYPFSRNRIVTNRKVWVSVGSLCVVYTLHPAQVGIQDILKLFSS
jgi:hypothetical protein